MRKKEKPPVEIEMQKEQFSMTLQGEQVLQCSLSWPELSGRGLGIRAINQYYRAVADGWRRRWKTTLYIQAGLDLANRAAAGKPFQPWQAELETEITLHTGDILSLKWIGQEKRGEGYPNMLCVGETWDIKNAAPMTLSDCCTPRHRKKEILARLEEELIRRMGREDSLYYQQSPAILRREYDPERFWIEPDGVCIFYPPELLGSRAEGMPVFVLPRQA